MSPVTGRGSGCPRDPLGTRVRVRGGDLDGVVAGLTADSPWGQHSALTCPHTGIETRDGRTERLAVVRRRCAALDRRIEDVVLVPVAELPEDEVPR